MKAKAVLHALAFAAFIIAAPSHSQVPSDLAALKEQAKKEGAVVFFTGSARYPGSAAKTLESAFEAKYGFPLKVQLAALGPHPTVVQQIRSEAQSGIAPAPIYFPALGFLKMLRESNAIAKVDWIKLGASPDVTVESESAVMINIIARNIIYNTNLVKADEAPKRLEDLAYPKWRGKIVAPAIGDAFAMMVPVLGEDKTKELVQTLVSDQKMALVQSITDVANKVASGEFALGFGVPADWTSTRSKGAPVQNAPLEKVSGQPFYAGVLRNAKHPSAATLSGLFICCSPEGQKALDDA